MGVVYAVILGGGRGLRLGSGTPKQILPLGGMPVMAWSMKTFEALEEIDRIVAVVPEEFIPEVKSIAGKINIGRLFSVIPGGHSRQASARNALTLLDYNDDDILMFHDAARPFIRPDAISRCLTDARAHGAAALYIPVRDTIAEIMDGYVSSVPSRKGMFQAQTPQAFRYTIIRTAHEKAVNDDPAATDDVALVLAAGFRVKMTEGDYSNFKITTPSDYRIACLIANDVTLEERSR